MPVPCLERLKNIAADDILHTAEVYRRSRMLSHVSKRRDWVKDVVLATPIRNIAAGKVA